MKTSKTIADPTARKIQELRRSEEKTARTTGRYFPRHGAKRRVIERLRSIVSAERRGVLHEELVRFLKANA